jgi:mRNA interferase MazF
MKFGDVFICRFPFTSGEISKPRPVLVLFNLGLDVVICRITSAQYSGKLEIPVVDWAAAGLAKPSVLRLTRLVTAEKALMRSRLGELSATDRAAAQAAWNSHMVL